MGGQLYLNNGQPPNRTNVCVSGYQRGKENFALSNFDDNQGNGYQFEDPHLGAIVFPTAEHYLHFQKIKPAFKAQYYQHWKNEKSPGVILAGIRNKSSQYYIQDAHHAYMTSSGFNPQWDQDKKYVQMQINATKYQQSKAFQDSIHQSIQLGVSMGDGKGPAAIIEDTSSLGKGQKPEEEWGTGPGGKGKNILGNSQTAFAMMVQSNQINTSLPELNAFRVQQVQNLYDEAEKQYQQGIQKSFADVRMQAGVATGMNQPDTSELNRPDLVQNISFTSLKQVKPFTVFQLSQQNFTAPQSVNVSSLNKNQPQYLLSWGGLQRLVIQNDQIIGYEFKRTPSSQWEQSRDPARFQGLINHFVQTQQMHSSQPQYVTSWGGLQRLVIQNNQITGYEFKRTPSSQWEQSGDPTRFQSLINHFVQTQQMRSITALQKQFLDQLVSISKKAGFLRQDGHEQAANCAHHLYETLHAHYDSWIKKEISDQTFQTQCSQAINTARPELEKHRGWKQLLGNLMLAIVGLGVFYVAAGLINKAVTGHFLFFKTDSEQKIDQLEHTLQSIPG